MKTTAEQFNKKPHDVYRAADQGETVTINHDRYKDKVFELTARDRGVAWDGNLSDQNNLVIAIANKLDEIMKREGKDTFTWGDIKRAQNEIFSGKISDQS